MKLKINLDTMSSISKFVDICSRVEHPVYLTDENGDFKVSAKSLLGALYTMEWSDVWCICDTDIYQKIQQFVI